jgi:antitoxin component YwqK of YwqJK toxin-antitoxin module
MSRFHFLFFLILSTSWIHSFHAQENCTFNTYNKKGSNYVFSTYYEADMKTPLQGKCESFIEGRLYERREFKNGHFISEEANFQDGKPRVILKRFESRADGLIAELKTYWELGQPAMYTKYYLDESGRRCMQQTVYHLNGKKRFVQSFAFVRFSEISEYEIKDHPPHTVDDEGYTYLTVQFGDEENYSTEGVLISKFHHKLILSEFSRNSSKDGPFTEYHENGKVKTKGYYKDGNSDGHWIGYNYLGMKNVDLTYRDNMIQGYYLTWYDNGQLHTEDFYDVTSNHPFQPTKKEWTENGKPLLLLTLDKNGDGHIQKWNENGMLLYETDIQNNNYKNAIEKEWYTDGKLKSLLNHLPNADTSFVSYFPNGIISEVHFDRYNAGIKSTKVQKEWFENGVLASEVETNRDDSTSSFLQRTFYANAKIKTQILQKGRERIEELYTSNGIKVRSRQTVDGKLEAPYRELDSLGNVLVAYSYKNGLRNGTCRCYNAKQELIFSQEYLNGCLIPSKTDLNNKRKLSVLSESERSNVYGLVHRQFFSSGKEHYTREHIDSLAQWYSYIMDCTPFTSFDFQSLDVGEQFVTVRFSMGAFPRLMEGDTTNPRNKEFYQSLQKLNWNRPTLEIVNGEYVGKIMLDGLYSYAIFASYFPNLQSWMEFGYTKESPREREVDFGWKQRYRPNSINIVRENAYLMRATMSIPAGNIPLLIYADGEVEVENQLFTNDDLLKDNNQMIHEIGWD